MAVNSSLFNLFNFLTRIMAGLNKVIIMGNLGGDPEIRQVGNSKVANFNIATSEKYKKQDGTVVEETEWHRIELWNAPADIAEKYLKKGNTCCVEGKIKTDEYTDKDGITRRSVKIRGEKLTLIGGGNTSNQTAQSSAPSQATQQSEDLPSSPQDDVPF